LFLMLGNLMNIIGVLLAKPLSELFGKKLVFTAGLIGTTLVQLVYLVLGPQDVGTMFLLTVLTGLCYGPTIPLLWAMGADTIDYGEWKFGRRATGFAFAGIVFALKAGLAFGGAFVGWGLAAYGYQAGETLTPAVLNGIRLMASVFSAIPVGLAAACILVLYPITKSVNLQMAAELAERRKQYSAPAQT
ncbi:MAG: MFS transporter, partial [Verrucomicrobiales bacterium]|nr:MFS transporter [Verrucomicrobiales bacterium]